jgi:hypothetical protein
MPDYSLDQFVAQAVEPMPPPPDIAEGVELDYLINSSMRMWFWEQDDAGKWEWNAESIQQSIEESMRAYILFWERTGWRLIRLKHGGQEQWDATLYSPERAEPQKTMNHCMLTGQGTTAAIAICEAIKAASLADESLKGDSLQGDGKDARSSAAENE